MTGANAKGNRRRLAIIGAGSSGLITLKYALESLPHWEVCCLEQSGEVTGVWGNPYPGFVSTSTKYATQFACYPIFDASVSDGGGTNAREFFRDGEYGAYLTQFAAEFGLRDHIQLHCRVNNLRRATDGKGWVLTVTRMQGDDQESSEECFDAVVICTGLAASAKQFDCARETLSLRELTAPAGLEHIHDQTIVVIGGGESAVDFANRLAKAELRNKVFLSLKSGIRVSPRYHPIRGVPSDFLRNRLMLSIHADLRNWIGQRFVEARIRYREMFERMFPGARELQKEPGTGTCKADERRKDWDHRLTRASKGSLFNVFHNKSDDFLEAVGQQRITIIGPAVDRDHGCFREFDSEQRVTVDIDLVVPAIGYRADLQRFSNGQLRLADFYLGCCHVEYPDLFLVGFARPIIGNIPSISEMQARFIIGHLAGEVSRPDDIRRRHQANRSEQMTRYPQLDADASYPVEMFPYCDELARQMGVYPSWQAAGSLRRWWQMQLEPATTIHYQRSATTDSPIYMPALLIILLLSLKPVDWCYRLMRLALARLRRNQLAAPAPGD